MSISLNGNIKIKILFYINEDKKKNAKNKVEDTLGKK
jgi:hypothetical protein